MRYKPSLSYAHRAGRPRPYGMSKLRLIISCFDNAARTHSTPYKPCLRHGIGRADPAPTGCQSFALLFSALTMPPYRIPRRTSHVCTTRIGRADPAPTGCRSSALMRLSTFYLVCTRVYEQDTCVLIVTLQLHKYVVVRRAEGD